MTKTAVRAHVDSALSPLCRFPSFDISIEDVDQAAEYTRGHLCDSDPIIPAFLDVMGLNNWYLWVEQTIQSCRPSHPYLARQFGIFMSTFVPAFSYLSRGLRRR
jgi:hypothetical protein